MDKVRFGVVGTNFISDWVIAGARQDERFELVAVYSRTQETADAFASKHNIPYTFTSLEEMAKSPLIDAVYIASPNFLHASQSILCMSYGKHVLCEKPFASNAKEVRAMIEASRTYNVTLMEAMKPTLTPNFLAVRENLGRVGTVRRYFACYCQYSSRYDKFKEGIVLNAFKPELSNGAMMDIGIYTVYPMVVLFGRPKKIDASGIVLSSGADGQGAVNFLYEGMNATALWKESVAERWDGIHVVSKDDCMLMAAETGQKIKVQYVIDEQGLNDAVGLELVVLKDQPEDGKQIYAVYPFKMVGHEGNNFTFEAEIEPINAGSFKTGVRMYPKNEKLPHRQDFCYVKWLD